MPVVKWGIGAGDVDDFDRDSQSTPYRGPVPPDGVYEFQVELLQYRAATKDKFPQLRIGLKLVPREGFDEDRFDGYWIMNFVPISDRTQFRYVPFLDAIGVSGDEFAHKTRTDENGNIQRIGRWRNTGDEIIAAQLKTGSDQNGDPRKEISWMGPTTEYEVEGDEEEEYYDEDGE